MIAGTRPASFLLVDADAAQRDAGPAVETPLERCLYRAAGSAEALDYLIGRGEYGDRERYPLPDIIALDLRLTRSERQRVIDHLAHTPGLAALPVLYLSASNDDVGCTVGYDARAVPGMANVVSREGFFDAVRQLADYWASLEGG